MYSAALSLAPTCYKRLFHCSAAAAAASSKPFRYRGKGRRRKKLLSSSTTINNDDGDDTDKVNNIINNKSGNPVPSVIPISTTVLDPTRPRTKSILSFDSSSFRYKRSVDPPPGASVEIPKLAHGLERVLFNPGVHLLSDFRTGIISVLPLSGFLLVDLDSRYFNWTYF